LFKTKLIYLHHNNLKLQKDVKNLLKIVFIASLKKMKNKN